MKTKAIIFLMSMVIFASSCSKEAEEAVVPTTTTFETNGNWDCALSESCQDVYELDLKEGSLVQIDVTQIFGNSVVNLAVYNPGVALGGINLLTGGTIEARCSDQDEDISRTFTAPVDGVYKFAVTRDWGKSAGFDGAYHLEVNASIPMVVGNQTADDTESLASGSGCPLIVL